MSGEELPKPCVPPTDKIYDNYHIIYDNYHIIYDNYHIIYDNYHIIII